jgi:uncharacterized protein (DUF488 family)
MMLSMCRDEPEAVISPTLFTIGYRGRSSSEFVERLRAAGVERVVDVRELPLSRRPGFSKSQLAAALRNAGIGYQHARALGNPKANRERWRSGDTTGGAVAFRRHLREAGGAALGELADAVPKETICLVCVEESHLDCHRSLIAGAIAERIPRVAVVHL